ncbi:hypothetical protein ACT4GF_004719 [Salmonella enterica subsp. enterica serovar Derby]
MSQFVLGLDIGYSNLKMAMGHKGGEARTVIMPVGAGPLELMPQQLTGGAGTSIQVVIDGEKWVAGVEPDCSGQLNPDTLLSRFSASAGGIPSLC